MRANPFTRAAVEVDRAGRMLPQDDASRTKKNHAARKFFVLHGLPAVRGDR
jgi:hypothetical protein